MGNYNPSQPDILGEEWVPIREENLIFSQVVNNVEIGTTFSETTSSVTSPYSGRFYINELPNSLVRNQVWTMAVYNRGEEAESGPIQRVVVPVSAGNITGSSSAVVLRNAADVTTALFDPSDRRYIEITLGNSLAFNIAIFFDINKYAPILQNKRILGVNFLYGGELLTQGDEAGQINKLQFYLRNNAGTNVIQYPPIMAGTTADQTTPFRNKEITRIAIGDTNMFFNPTTGVDITEAIPWFMNPSGLGRFDPSNASPVSFYMDSIGAGGIGPHWTWDYCGLEIVFCEEKRLAVGSAVIQYGTAATTRNYILGYNNVNLYTPGGGNPPTLNNIARDYTLTLAQGSMGDSPLAFSLQPIGAQPQVNALRELYPVEPQVGVQINIPSPPTEEIVGEVFTAESTSILPQLSLHNTSFTTTYPWTHSYGRQSVAQIYGTKFASQRIDDSQIPSTSYSKVRFYARRFGNTVIPLTLTGPTTSAFINPSDFDVLDPIIDGWKEITLQLDPPAVMGGTGNPTWTFTSTQESAGNRWEVLGAAAISQEGVVYQPNVQTTNLGITTYGAPISGSQIYETWMPQSLPYVSGSTVDSTADAAIYFSWTPPAITGMSVVTANQALSGIGTNCGVAPEFIPTALQYNRVTWAPNTAYYVQDVFQRTVASSWGTASSGQHWGASSFFSVTPGAGLSTGSATPGAFGVGMLLSQPEFAAYDTKGYVEIASTVAPSGGPSGAGVMFRVENGTSTPAHEIMLILYFNLDNTVSFGVTERAQSGNVDRFTSGPMLDNYVLGTKVKLRWQYVGQTILARMWADGTTEPTAWQLDYDIYGPNSWTSRGFGAQATRGVGASVPLFRFTNLLVANATNGYMELQRRDEITDWQTIMKGTWMATSGFNDYEARIGLLTDYRIRYVNKYGFEGPWSSTVSNTIPAPGVTAGRLGANDQVFAFTTNEHQDGSSNLAYSPAWTGTVQEEFSFPESAGQVFQTMYGRDYVTVFRPEERGGTNFTRNILVQAAAISPPTLEDFTSLRDMAWADVSYICVRDAEGNRWFANVSVPSGSVTHYRKLYMAPFSVVQVTDTPSPVDPSWLA